MRWFSRFLGSRLLLALCAVMVGLPASGEELLPANRAIEAAIDHYLQVRFGQQQVTPAPLADDGNLLRRTMLDLVGRIPTLAETQHYLADAAPAKRVQLVDRLLASPAYVRQQAAEFDALLMRGTNSNLREYLAEAFRENRSWDQMFREMIVGEENDPQQKGGVTFLKSRIKDLDRLTAETSSLFFGVNVSCAQCHDHPLVVDWTQQHYYGMKSFFSRTYENGDFLGEKDYGLVDYKTPKGEGHTAKTMFLTGEFIDEPENKEPDEKARKEEKNQLEELKKHKQPPAKPSFSRRQKLVEVALKDDGHPYFARAIVNHIWRRLLGRGLVSPTDQMHSGNDPSHPELLAWLARDLQTHGYDLKRLIRGIALSQAYARSSRWENSAPRPADELFAVALVRPLTPWQYGTTLKLASLSPDQFPATLSADDLDKKMQGVEGSGRGLANTFELPGDDFQVSVDEALLLSNSDRFIRELLRDGKDMLTGKLAELKEPGQIIETAYWTVMNRAPDEAERAAITEYLTQRHDRLPEACRQVVWALLASSECRFNY